MIPWLQKSPCNILDKPSLFKTNTREELPKFFSQESEPTILLGTPEVALRKRCSEKMQQIYRRKSAEV